MNLTYNNNEPAANNDPSNSQSPMLTNTKSINSWVNIDHHGFGDNIGGYHRNIRQDTATPVQKTVDRTVSPSTFTGFPTPITGINQLFAANVKVFTSPSPNTKTDTQLFSVTGAGGISQLTGNFIPGFAAGTGSRGYCWVGGLLIQWGAIYSTTAATYTFTSDPNCIEFPGSCVSVQCTVMRNTGSTSNSSANVVINQSTLAKTSFGWNWAGSTSNYVGFLWLAIGN